MASVQSQSSRRRGSGRGSGRDEEQKGSERRSGRPQRDTANQSSGKVASGDEKGNERDEKAGSKGKNAGSRSSLAKNKHIIEESIYVGVPHKVAYDQWTQYSEWSKIFKKESANAGGGGKGARGNRGGDHDDEQQDKRKVTVTAKIGPSRREWQTEVVNQKPGRRIEWEAKGGVQARGVVTFHRLGDRLTHLSVVIHYQPSGFMETIGNFLRMQRRRVRKDLKLFKNFVDLRGEATGEGPGRIRGDGLREGLDRQLEEAQDSGEDGGDGDDRNGDNKNGDTSDSNGAEQGREGGGAGRRRAGSRR